MEGKLTDLAQINAITSDRIALIFNDGNVVETTAIDINPDGTFTTHYIFKPKK